MAEFLTPTGIVAVAKDVDKFIRDMDRMNTAVENYGKKSTRTLKASNIQWDDMAQSAGRAGTALMAFSAVGVALILSTAKLAARVQTLGVVTRTLGKHVGKTDVEMTQLERDIAAQGITMQASRQAIAMMIESQVDLANATELARIAQDAAVIANMNSSQAFEHLVYTIQTGNVRMGRTLGLQLQFGQAQREMADSLGKTVDQLTDTEIIQSRVNEVMETSVMIQGAYDAAMTTTGKQLTSLPRHLETARVAFGEVFVEMLGTAIANLTEFLVAFAEMPIALRAQAVSAIAAGIAMAGVIGVALKIAKVIQLTVIPAIKAMTIETALATGGISLLLGALAAIVVTAASSATKLSAGQQAFEGLAREAVLAGESYEEFNRKQMQFVAENQLAWRELRHTTALVHDQGIAMEGTTIEIDYYTAGLERFTEESYNAYAANVLQARGYEILARQARSRSESEEEALSTESIMMESVRQSRRDYITSAHDVATASRDMWGSMTPNMAGIIDGWTELIDFYQNGGLEIQMLAQNIWDTMRSGGITPGEAEELLNPLADAARFIDRDWGTGVEDAAQIGADVNAAFQEALAVTPMEEKLFGLVGAELFDPIVLATIPEDLEDAFSAYGLSDAIADDMGNVQTQFDSLDFAGLEENLSQALVNPAQRAVSLIDSIPAVLQTEWIVNMQYVGGEPPQFAHGGSFVVDGPPGVDRVPVQFMATAGERVNVAPNNYDQRSVSIGEVNNNNRIDDYSFDQAMRRWMGST